jgi:hypothetical protein
LKAPSASTGARQKGATSASAEKAVAERAPSASRTRLQAMDTDRAIAFGNKLVPMQAQLIRTLMLVSKSWRLAAVGGATNAGDGLMKEIGAA